MEIVGKKELLLKVMDAIRNVGWNVTLLSSIDKHPLKLKIENEDEQENLLVYIWNITHGGKTRSEDEFRIQITGVKKLEFIEGFKTLLLGLELIDNNEVFVAFNPFKHSKFGFSPSIQVNRQTLVKALEHGISFQEKSRNPKGGINEIVIAFSPTHIIEYISHIYPEYHAKDVKEIIKPEAELILKNPLDAQIPIKEFEKLPSERKKVVEKINRLVRDRKFRNKVLILYKGKCAICGLQAGLTIGAHIVSVKDKGTDEVTNGILLCYNHHKAFDSGLLAVDENFVIRLNKKYVEQLRKMKLDEGLEKFIKESRIGEKIFLPDEKKFYPNKEYLKKNLKLKGIQFFL